MAEFLERLLSKRSGGAVNIRGIRFQMIYACYRLLQEAVNQHTDITIRLEGFEDLDIEQSSMHFGNGEYIQLKSSISKMDASAFWATGTLRNFFEQYQHSHSARFTVVHSMDLAKGALAALATRELDNATINFWFEKLRVEFPSASKEDITNFLQHITFTRHSLQELEKGCELLLYKHFNVNNGTAPLYLKGLLFQTMLWSELRTTVRVADINQLIGEVLDSLTSHATNPAFANLWIEEVQYDSKLQVSDGLDYYKGVAARPSHILQDLPVKRSAWNSKIKKAITDVDVTVIRASSGQGKSTLAWQMGRQMQQEGYTIYQIHTCNEPDRVGAIKDFLISRLRIGQLPLLIIDGLNASVKDWTDLVDRTTELPVKYIITSREDEWYRHSTDLSRVSIQVLDISLSFDEAKEIHRQLLKKGLVHESIVHWQAAWEEVESKGLLIEFAYLLTQGAMLRDRLSAQIKELAREADGKAKLEILRIVSLADVLGLSIPVQELFRQIEGRIGTSIDRGQLFIQLEREYYLRFNERYVQGLHRIRSQHLIELLHGSIPFSETLLNMFELVPETQYFDYFSRLGTYLSLDERKSNLKALAERLGSKPITLIVQALKGLFQYEFEQCYYSNKEVFDKADELGGLALFAIDSSPFMPLNTIEKLAGDLGEKLGGNLTRLASLKKQLNYTNWSESSVHFFTNSLAETLTNNPQKFNSFLELTTFSRWFKHLSTSHSVVIQLDEQFFLEVLNQGSLDEAKEIFSYARNHAQNEYNQFVRVHKKELIAWLKRETNTPTIYESGEDICMEYLLDNATAASVNNQSVSRIEAVHAILPPYGHYRTQIIVPPFPHEALYEGVIIDAKKGMTSATLHLSDDALLNRLWATTVEAPYRCKSGYEWQEQYYNLRLCAVSFSLSLSRFLDGCLEGNNSKSAGELLLFEKNWKDLEKRLFNIRRYPALPNNNLQEQVIEKQERALTDWAASLRNFTNQFIAVFKTENGDEGENNHHIAFANLRKTVHSLPSMQLAYASICNETRSHFPVKELIEKEAEVYKRLEQTFLFYKKWLDTGIRAPVRVGKKAAEAWVQEQETALFNELHHILLESSSVFGFEFISPNYLVVDEMLKYAIIGVKNCDFNSEYELEQLLFSLSKLKDLEITFFTFAPIDGEGKTRPTGVRVSRDMFEAIDRVSNGEPFEEPYSKVLPIVLDSDALAPLGNIPIEQPTNQSTFEKAYIVMHQLWQLLEYRQRLNNLIVQEDAWYKNLESKLLLDLQASLHECEIAMPQDRYIELKEKSELLLTDSSLNFREEIAEFLKELSTGIE